MTLRHNTAIKKYSQHGFSLVELLVAMLISIFLIGASVMVLISNSALYNKNLNDIEIQDNSRFSMDVLINDLSMAGFYGCGKQLVNNLNSVFIPVGHILDTTFPIDGLDDSDPNLWLAQGSANTTPDIIAGTDAITIRKLRSKGIPLNQAIIPALSPTFLVDSVGLNAGNLAVIYDCKANNLFQTTAVSNDSVSHAAGGAFFPGNIDVSFYKGKGTERKTVHLYEQAQHYLNNAVTDTNNLFATTYIAPFDAFRYFISDPEGDGPGIWRESHDHTLNQIVQVELIEGVENMQILYYVEPEGGLAPTYVRADQVNATANSVVDASGAADGFNHVTAIKINLLVRSVFENPREELDTKTYDIHGTPGDTSDDVGPFNDRRHRNMVSTTIVLRNRSIGD